MGFNQTLKGLGREGASFKHNLFVLFCGFTVFNLLNMDLARIHRQWMDWPHGAVGFQQACIDPRCYSREIIEFA